MPPIQGHRRKHRVSHETERARRERGVVSPG